MKEKHLMQMRRSAALAGVLSICSYSVIVHTFSDPPADAGLFDIGPFTGMYLLALSIRLYHAKSTRPYRINHL